MKFLTIISLWLLSVASYGQADEWAALSRDIWKPFVEGVNANRPEIYNGVNAEDFLWAAAGKKPRVMNLEEYEEDARVVMQDRQQKGIQTQLDLRFAERQVHKDVACEKLLIKYTATERGKAPVVAYGAALMFSRKREGVWKKVLQLPLPDAVTAADFDQAQPLE